jgi:hypothetical protein
MNLGSKRRRACALYKQKFAGTKRLGIASRGRKH